MSMSEDARPGVELAELDPETQAFLMRLRREDVILLQAGIDLVRSAMTIGRFSRWLIISLVGAILGGVMLGEALMKILTWFRSAAR